MKSCGLIREAVDTQLWSADVLHQLGNGIHELRCPNNHHQLGKGPCEDETNEGADVRFKRNTRDLAGGSPRTRPQNPQSCLDKGSKLAA